MPPIKRERIACAAVPIYHPNSLTTFVNVPINRLPMDVINDIIRDHPSVMFDANFHFVTTGGRIVDGNEGYDIALSANQLLDDTAKKPLSPMAIWPYKKA